MSAAPTKQSTQPLFTGAEWDFALLKKVYGAIEEVAVDDLKLDTYPNQIEIISSEQMLDAYSAHGMPLMYHHWSFGKIFAREETSYQKGWSGLAYEIVINANPCIAYLMEENTMTMQSLVMAQTAGNQTGTANLVGKDVGFGTDDVKITNGNTVWIGSCSEINPGTK